MEVVYVTAALLILALLIFLAMRVKKPDECSPDDMSGREFEEYAAEILEHAGYEILQLTKASGDFGADIIVSKDGERIAVQCKRYDKPVGVSAVQEASASKAHYSCSAAAVFTNSTFTKQARTLAAELGVILWDGEELESFTSAPSRQARGYRPTAPVTIAPVVSERDFDGEIYLDDEAVSQGVFCRPVEKYVTHGNHTVIVRRKRKKSVLSFTVEDSEHLIFAAGECRGRPFVYELIVGCKTFNKNCP